MRNKKRLIGLIGLISLIFVVASSNTFTNFTPITATEKIYTLVLDGSTNKGSGVPIPIVQQLALLELLKLN